MIRQGNRGEIAGRKERWKIGRRDREGEEEDAVEESGQIGVMDGLLGMREIVVGWWVGWGAG